MVRVVSASVVRIALLAGVGALFAGLPGCASRPRTIGYAPLRHVVIAQLNDAGEARAFSTDAGSLLGVPGVVNVITGPVIGPEVGAAAPPEATPGDAVVQLDISTLDHLRELDKSPAYAGFIAKWRAKSRSLKTLSFGPHCEE